MHYVQEISITEPALFSTRGKEWTQSKIPKGSIPHPKNAGHEGGTCGLLCPKGKVIKLTKRPWTSILPFQNVLKKTSHEEKRVKWK